VESKLLTSCFVSSRTLSTPLSDVADGLSYILLDFFVRHSRQFLPDAVDHLKASLSFGNDSPKLACADDLHHGDTGLLDENANSARVDVFHDLSELSPSLERGDGL
jgi:hypothetical protein